MNVGTDDVHARRRNEGKTYLVDGYVTITL